jgi:hypothetical protein
MTTALQFLAAAESVGLEADEAFEVYMDLVFSPCANVVTNYPETRAALAAEGHRFAVDCELCRCIECGESIHRSAFCPQDR